MKLTIDTKEDSHDDIKKVIKMLQHLVSEGSYSNYSSEPTSRNIFDDPSPSLGSSEPEPVQEEAPTNAFSAMFGDEASAPSSDTETSSYDPEPEEEKRLNMDEEIIPY